MESLMINNVRCIHIIYKNVCMCVCTLMCVKEMQKERERELEREKELDQLKKRTNERVNEQVRKKTVSQCTVTAYFKSIYEDRGYRIFSFTRYVFFFILAYIRTDLLKKVHRDLFF